MLCLLALLVITGCSSGAGRTQAGQTPSPSGGVASNLTCRLPVTAATSEADAAPGGWVTFPGGQFVRDPASNPHGASYDRAIGAWVPVESENVAPDGASYVLHEEQSSEKPDAFYIVDAKTGNRRLILSKLGPTPVSRWQVVDYASEGIYLSAPNYGVIQPVPGLWLLDPQTGRVRLINGDHYWVMVAGSVAWGQDPPGHPAKSSKVYRLDLLTGKVITWYEAKTDVRLLSPTPDGELLVAYGDIHSPRLALLAGPGLFVPIEVPPDFPIFTARLAHPGVWIALYGEAWSGIALYVKGEGVSVMALSTYPLEAAGGCS